MADKAQMVELLQALTSTENATRQKAETMYQQAKTAGADSLIINMMTVLGDSTVEEAIRRHNAVLLRQLMMKGSEKDFVWSRITAVNQQQVAAELLTRFEAEAAPKLQKKIGEIIAKLVEYVCDKDDPRGSLSPGAPCGWPALLPQVFRMAHAGTSPRPESCEGAIRLIKEFVPTLKDEIVGAQQELSQILQAGLSSPTLRIQAASLLLICEIVGETQKKAWAPLTATLSVLVQVLRRLAQAAETDLLQEAIQALMEVASVEPDFFKAELTKSMEPANFMGEVAKTREGVDEGLRGLALEWLVTIVEKRAKWATKNLPSLAPLALQACMHLMVEVDDGKEELEAWAARMDDEEGEEDEDELFHAGEESIDRVVEAVGMDALCTTLFQLIAHFVGQESWQAKHAALAAVKQTCEYIEEKPHIDEMAKLLLQHVNHPHPRVRYTALHAIGQLANDQSPYFQESTHKTVMPVLLAKFDDPVNRVAAMAMSGFVSFGEELDTSLMQAYSDGLMQKLVSKLQTSEHRGVREECITSIAVIAGVTEKDFSKYYDSIMPMLKHFVMTATSQTETRLRGKSFECMSLLGIAVGKEKFLPDARDCIMEMLKYTVEADDVQREYIKEASERICQCLKKDFAPFLPPLLQGICKSLSLDDLAEDSAKIGKTAADDDDDDAYVQVTSGDGKLISVRTSKFEEMMQSVQMLHTFITEMEGAYFNYIEATAKCLLPHLEPSNDDIAALCEEVRGTALQCWGLLIKSARKCAEEQGQPNSPLAAELLRKGLQATFQVLEQNQDDCEMLTSTACGMTECVKCAGPGVLSGDEVKTLVERVFVLIDASFTRTADYQKTKAGSKAAEANLPKELGDEEDEDEPDPDAEEEQLRRNYEEVLGAVMEVAAAEFMPCLPGCAEKVRQWVASDTNKVLGLYLACDAIQHLKEHSVQMWPVFMPETFNVLRVGKDHDAMTAAAYAINLAAPLASFAEAAPDAFRGLASIVGGAKPKKKDTKLKMVHDNTVAALLTLAVEKASACPPEVQAWRLIVDKLPLREDEDEAVKVHEKVVDLVLAQHQGLLDQRTGPVLSVLAEIYHVESICNKDTEAKILQVFRAVPTAALQQLAPQFSEKQQKKIEKMLQG